MDMEKTSTYGVTMMSDLPEPPKAVVKHQGGGEYEVWTRNVRSGVLIYTTKVATFISAIAANDHAKKLNE